MKILKSFLIVLLLSPFIVTANTVYQVNFFDSGWEDIEAGDCLMIMGAKVLDDGRPDLMMKERLDTAIDIIDEDLNKIILSGGSIDENPTEARVMKEVLVENGIAEDRLILEEDSTSTFENLVFSKVLFLENNCEKVDIISHDFHLARIKLTADRLEIPVNRLIPAKTSGSNSQERINREYKAYIWYWLGWRFFK